MGRLYQHQSTGFDMSDNFVRVYPWGEQKNKYIGLHLPFLLFPVNVCAQSFSHVQLLVTPWTIASQAPLSMGFSRRNTGVGCHALLQGFFLTQGSNPGLLHCRQILYPEPPGYTSFKIKVKKNSYQAYLKGMDGWVNGCPLYILTSSSVSSVMLYASFLGLFSNQ